MDIKSEIKYSASNKCAHPNIVVRKPMKTTLLSALIKLLNRLNSPNGRDEFLGRIMLFAF